MCVTFLSSYHTLRPLWNASDQSVQCMLRSACPNLSGGLRSFCYGYGKVLGIPNPSTKHVPHISNEIEVWTASWPLHYINFLSFNILLECSCSVGSGILVHKNKVRTNSTSKNTDSASKLSFRHLITVSELPAITTSSVLPNALMPPETTINPPPKRLSSTVSTGKNLCPGCRHYCQRQSLYDR